MREREGERNKEKQSDMLFMVLPQYRHQMFHPMILSHCEFPSHLNIAHDSLQYAILSKSCDLGVSLRMIHCQILS